MTETAHLVKYPMYVEDLGLGTGTATITLQGTGYTRTLLDTRNFPLSSAIKTTYGLAGPQYIDAVLTTLSTATAVATTTTRGITKVDDNGSGDPVAMTTTGTLAARIPTAAIGAALTNSAQTPGYGNPFVTRYETQLARSLSLGSGMHGHGKFGSIAANSTAPASLDTATAGLLTGTYTYKIAAYNLAGAIVSSSASASTGAITTKQVTMTLPELPTNAMGWRIYRSTDGANWYYVGAAVLGFNYTETASDARQYKYTDNNPIPDTSKTAPGSDTTGNSATMSGLYQFITFTTTASTAITVASSGVTAGLLDIRIQGTWTGADAAWSITGTGANTVIGRLRGFATSTTGTTGYPAMFIGQTAWATTFNASAVTSFSSATSSTAFGLGADTYHIGSLLSGFGTAGAGTTGGAGAYGGGLVRILGYTTATGTIGGTITVSGAAGSAGTANGGGGGGGAGGLIDIGCVLGWKDTGTRTAAGGAGGNGAGTGRGGGGGGGGAVVRRGCYDKASSTPSVAAGAQGTNGGTTADGGIGGAHYGNSGCNTTAGTTAATAGQQFDFNGFFDPSTVFAA